MGFWDYVIIAAILAALAAAVCFTVRNRKRGKSCCGDCSSCGGCGYTDKKSGE